MGPETVREARCDPRGTARMELRSPSAILARLGGRPAGAVAVTFARLGWARCCEPPMGDHHGCPSRRFSCFKPLRRIPRRRRLPRADAVHYSPRSSSGGLLSALCRGKIDHVAPSLTVAAPPDHELAKAPGNRVLRLGQPPIPPPRRAWCCASRGQRLSHRLEEVLHALYWCAGTRTERGATLLRLSGGCKQGLSRSEPPTRCREIKESPKPDSG